MQKELCEVYTKTNIHLSVDECVDIYLHVVG